MAQAKALNPAFEFLKASNAPGGEQNCVCHARAGLQGSLTGVFGVSFGEDGSTGGI